MRRTVDLLLPKVFRELAQVALTREGKRVSL